MNYTGEAQGAVGAQRGRVLILDWVKDHKELPEDALAPSLGMSMGFPGKPGERGILQEVRRACFLMNKRERINEGTAAVTKEISLSDLNLVFQPCGYLWMEVGAIRCF